MLYGKRHDLLRRGLHIQVDPLPVSQRIQALALLKVIAPGRPVGRIGAKRLQFLLALR